MSADELLDQLSAVDSASPPPPGPPITAARLTARLKQRRVRALATSAAVVLLGLGTWTLLAQPEPHNDDPVQSSVAADLNAEMAQLADRIDRLLGDLDAPLPEVHTGHKQLRFELATARANGLLAFQSNADNTTPKEIR